MDQRSSAQAARPLHPSSTVPSATARRFLPPAPRHRVTRHPWRTSARPTGAPMRATSSACATHRDSSRAHAHAHTRSHTSCMRSCVRRSRLSLRHKRHACNRWQEGMYVAANLLVLHAFLEASC
eukprot:350572-Chlamydomonas_euryale.AAC.4